MTGQLPAVVAILLSLALLPQFIFTHVYAKGPIYNADHTLGQFGMLLLVPLGIAIVALGLRAVRARQNKRLVER